MQLEQFQIYVDDNTLYIKSGATVYSMGVEDKTFVCSRPIPSGLETGHSVYGFLGLIPINETRFAVFIADYAHEFSYCNDTEIVSVFSLRTPFIHMVGPKHPYALKALTSFFSQRGLYFSFSPQIASSLQFASSSQPQPDNPCGVSVALGRERFVWNMAMRTRVITELQKRTKASRSEGAQQSQSLGHDSVTDRPKSHDSSAEPSFLSLSDLMPYLFCGYASQSEYIGISATLSARYTLITRKSIQWSGKRFFNRGLNMQGYAGNEAETELILQVLTKGHGFIEHNPEVYSFVTLRGAAPMTFQQEPDLSAKPRINVMYKQDIQDIYARFRGNLASLYGDVPILYLNLLDTRRAEASISECMSQNIVVHDYLGGSSEYTKSRSDSMARSAPALARLTLRKCPSDWEPLNETSIALTFADKKYRFEAENVIAQVEAPIETPAEVDVVQICNIAEATNDVSEQGSSELDGEHIDVPTAAELQCERYAHTLSAIYRNASAGVVVRTDSDQYFHLDFHGVISARFASSTDVLDSITGFVTEQLLGFPYKLAPNAEQASLMRINCLDSLDRTNAAQFSVYRKYISASLSDCEGTSFYLLFQDLAMTFCDHGNTLAHLYASTDAMKGDLTLTGTRTVKGKFKDLRSWFLRWYHGNLTDGLVQDGYYLVHGFTGLETSMLHLNFFALLGGLLGVAVFMSFLLPAIPSYTYQLFVGVCWLVCILIIPVVVYSKRRVFVRWPHFIPADT